MPQTYEYYISKGFDSKAARYFANGRQKPIKVIPQNDYKLVITFDNSICWDKNLEIDSNIDWSNKIDIGADSCYMDSTPIYSK